MGFAHAFDFQTTEQDYLSGAGTEANPFLKQVVTNRNEFVGVKVGAGVIPVILELVHMHKHPEYLPVYTIANFGMSADLNSENPHARDRT